MQTTKRDLFNAVVADVTGDFPLVWEYAENAMPSQHDPETYVQYEVMDDLYLSVPTTAFGNVTVRDALIMEASKDEKFCFVLSNKIIHTVRDADVNDHNVTQDDLEALATAIQLGAIWGQVHTATSLIEVAEHLVSEYDLNEPSVIGVSKGLIVAQSLLGMDIEGLRKQTIEQIQISLED
ncbi:hypothetical protein UFOVP965_101 [uncultured Caudovirales phage]|uniref:Uncharacterized protein n=1 Tax=uncultured Caudovirales phage TaxID=2100421 RepID=A0A6J5QY69_9CAUD|nr:hypothetical protein UFOVP965_101 [uncultured Caudovirales phage]CAB4179883.1 hypothetical protein UFOVP1035_97 [uncultured Caudovirales phage]CAB4188702.1 hypothetical protein UFOVP1181_56 [uncultured Caudovirales phage]